MVELGLLPCLTAREAGKVGTDIFSFGMGGEPKFFLKCILLEQDSPHTAEGFRNWATPLGKKAHPFEKF